MQKLSRREIDERRVIDLIEAMKRAEKTLTAYSKASKIVEVMKCMGWKIQRKSDPNPRTRVPTDEIRVLRPPLYKVESRPALYRTEAEARSNAHGRYVLRVTDWDDLDLPSIVGVPP